MYKIKLHKTSKCLWPVNIDMFVVKYFFFDIFINHFPKIHINVFRKITRAVLYFWNAYDVNLWENISGEVEPIHAEQMSFYNNSSTAVFL